MRNFLQSAILWRHICNEKGWKLFTIFFHQFEANVWEGLNWVWKKSNNHNFQHVASAADSLFVLGKLSRGEWRRSFASGSFSPMWVIAEVSNCRPYLIMAHRSRRRLRLCYRPVQSVGPIGLESLFTNIISFVTQCDSVAITKFLNVHVSNPFMPSLHDNQTHFPAICVVSYDEMEAARSKMSEEEHKFGTSLLAIGKATQWTGQNSFLWQHGMFLLLFAHIVSKRRRRKRKKAPQACSCSLLLPIRKSFQVSVSVECCESFSTKSR